MDVQITGTVTRILPEQSGEGRNGPWRKQEFILETQDTYPRQICIIQWGDNIEEFSVQEGETLTARVDIQSREYNGRWYTDVKAWRVERPKDTPEPPAAVDEAPAGGGGGQPDDDLPF